MRYPAPTVLPDAVFQGRAVGPVAPPGTYTLELSANGVRARTTATIVKDPRVTYTDAELDAQFTFLMTVRDQLTETMTVVKRVRDMRATAENLVKQAKESRRGQSPEAMRSARQRDEGPEQPPLHDRGAAGAVSRQGQSGPHRQPDGHRQQACPAPRVRIDGRRPPTDGSKDLLKRLTDGISERSVAADGVERKEMAALTKLATSMMKK